MEVILLRPEEKVPDNIFLSLGNELSTVIVF